MEVKKGMINDSIYIEDNNVSVLLHLSEMENKDGYYNILYAEPLDDEKNVEFISGLIDENLNQIIPIKREAVSKEQLNEIGRNRYISVFENKRAIYTTKNQSYVIDLENVSFHEENGVDIPDRYIKKFDLWYNLGNSTIIIIMLGKMFLYRVSDDKTLSPVFDTIIPNNDGKLYAYYINGYGIMMEMDYNGNVSKMATIIDAEKNTIEVMLPDNVIGDRELTLEYCQNCVYDLINNAPKGPIQ